MFRRFSAISLVFLALGCGENQQIHSSLADGNVDATGERYAKGSDRDVIVPNNLSNQMFFEYGNDLWSGYASFTASCACESNFDFVVVHDGRGDKWTLTSSQQVFSRIQMPVHFLGKSDGSSTSQLLLRNIEFFLHSTEAVDPFEVVGMTKANVRLRSWGDSIPGVKVTISVSASFYENFSNGSDCSRIVLGDSKGEHILDNDHNQLSNITLVAPFYVDSRPTCVASRISSPERTNMDYFLRVDPILVGDPI
jgi:hypothetical protein